jgi:ribosomal protein S21
MDKKPVILPETTIINYEFEKMLKQFLKQVMKDGILQEIKERRYYTKSSEIRHKLLGAIKRKAKLERKRRRKK